MIPPFEEGNLPVGVHQCNTTEFLESFCNTEYRKQFQKSLSDVFDYCKEKGATRLIIGGSYVTDKEQPSDFDCVIVFPKTQLIPEFADSAVDGDIAFDILFASEDYPDVVDGYVTLFSNTRTGVKRGVIEINFNSTEPWEVQHSFDEKELNVIRRAYTDRKIIERKEKRGILVTIHGINTVAAWNADIAPIASFQGWVFAPFVYDNPISLLVCRKKREEVVQRFREFVYDIYATYQLPVSVISHSFGSYIISRYLRDTSPEFVEFDSVILTGGIVDTHFDWSHILYDRAAAVMNINTKSDMAVWFMPPRWMVRILSKLRILDVLFGKCGIKEFERPHKDLYQRELNILDHCHVFKRDFIYQIMMPFFNSHLNGFYAKSMARLEAENECCNASCKIMSVSKMVYSEGTNFVRKQHGVTVAKQLNIID